MKNQELQQQIDSCAERFRAFLEEKIEPSTIFNIMDDILYNYVINAVAASENSAPIKGEADRIFILKELRDLFITEK